MSGLVLQVIIKREYRNACNEQPLGRQGLTDRGSWGVQFYSADYKILLVQVQSGICSPTLSLKTFSCSLHLFFQ